MKKLMIAAAIVCAAVVGQAATVNWQVDWAYSNYGSVNTFDAPGEMTYWIVNMAGSTDTSGLSIDKDGNLVNSAGYGILETGSITESGGATTPDGVVANGNYLAMVIYDAANGLYGVSEANIVSGIVEAPPTAGALAASFSNDGGSNPDGDPYMTANTPIPTSPVPEPTSGLLMLLGVVGLALKRKRA